MVTNTIKVSPLFAHVLGLPVEETVIQFVPFGLALVMAVRVTLRRVTTRTSRKAGGDPHG
jgi:hypothetical protein